MEQLPGEIPAMPSPLDHPHQFSRRTEVGDCTGHPRRPHMLTGGKSNSGSNTSICVVQQCSLLLLNGDILLPNVSCMMQTQRVFRTHPFENQTHSRILLFKEWELIGLHCLDAE